MSFANLRAFLLLFLLFLCTGFSPLRADVVVLRSGATYSDVRAEPFAEAHRVFFSDGRVLVIPNSEIRSVRPGPITWKKPIPSVRQAKPQPIEPASPILSVPEPKDRPLFVPEEAGIKSTRTGGRRWGPILKSALFPGWGQYDEARRWNGSLYALSSVLVLQRYWTLRQMHAAAEQEYNDPLPVGAVVAQAWTGSLSVLDAAAINLAYLSQKEQQVYHLQAQGNAMVDVFAFIWAWNMLDITSGGILWWKRGPVSASGESVLNFRVQKDSITVSVSTYL